MPPLEPVASSRNKESKVSRVFNALEDLRKHTAQGEIKGIEGRQDLQGTGDCEGKPVQKGIMNRGDEGSQGRRGMFRERGNRGPEGPRG